LEPELEKKEKIQYRWRARYPSPCCSQWTSG